MVREEIIQKLSHLLITINSKTEYYAFYREVKKELELLLNKLSEGSLKSDISLSGAISQMITQITVLETKFQMKLTQEEKSSLREMKSLVNTSKDEMIGILCSLGMF